MERNASLTHCRNGCTCRGANASDDYVATLVARWGFRDYGAYLMELGAEVPSDDVADFLYDLGVAIVAWASRLAR